MQLDNPAQRLLHGSTARNYGLFLLQLVRPGIAIPVSATFGGVSNAPRGRLKFDLVHRQITWQEPGNRTPRVFDCGDLASRDANAIAKKPMPLLAAKARCEPRAFSYLLLLAIARHEGPDGWLCDNDERLTGLPGWAPPAAQRNRHSVENERKWKGNAIRSLVPKEEDAESSAIVKRRRGRSNSNEILPATRLEGVELPDFNLEAALRWVQEERHSTAPLQGTSGSSGTSAIASGRQAGGASGPDEPDADASKHGVGLRITQREPLIRATRGIVTFRVGDILSHGGVDLTLLPSSAKGRMSAKAKSHAVEYRLPFPQPKPLGTIEVLDVAGPGALTARFAWAASVLNDYSSAEVLEEIGRNVAAVANRDQKVRVIESPLLGAGAGKLLPEVAGLALRRGFLQACSVSATLFIYVIYDDTFRTVMQALEGEATGQE